MTEIMDSIVRQLVVNTKPKDAVKIFIDHPVLTQPISFPFVKVIDLNGEMIMNEISKVVQSNKILTLDNSITFHTLIMHYLTGGGGGEKSKRLNKFLINKQCVIRIKPNKDDKLCAIVVGKALADRDSNLEEIKNSRHTLQSRLALKLANDLGLPISEELGLNEIAKVEKFLKNYQIFVFDNDSFNKHIYIGPLKEKKIFFTIIILTTI